MALKQQLMSNKATAASRVRSRAVRCNVVCQAGSSRREVLQQAAAAAVIFSAAGSAQAAVPVEVVKMLCDEDCVAKLDSIETVTTASGLQYKEIVAGSGPKAPVGFQVVCDYVAMTPKGKVFDSSLEKGKPYDIRVGAGQVLAGLDEALLDMRVGSLRRLYIPGNLAFPNGLKAAAGRPSVPASTPVIFDVKLLYIPGLEADDE